MARHRPPPPGRETHRSAALDPASVPAVDRAATTGGPPARAFSIEPGRGDSALSRRPTMSRPSKLLAPLLACVWLSSVLAIGVAVAAPDRAGTSRLTGPGCPNDADCDGIPNAIEAAVGGAGIDPVAGTAVTSA